MWRADYSSHLTPRLSGCAALSLGEKWKILKRKRWHFNTGCSPRVSEFHCVYMLCCLPTMQTALLEAITSLVWQLSELVSCSSSPGIGEMMRSSVVNKRHSRKGACWCRLCTAGSSSRTEKGLLLEPYVHRKSGHILNDQVYTLHWWNFKKH